MFRLLGLGPLIWVLGLVWKLVRKLLGLSASSDQRVFEYRGGAEIESVEVVGESRRQDGLWRVAGSREPIDGRQQLIRAQISKEPDNPVDPHAIAVWVMAEDASEQLRAGYLPRGSAYREPLEHLAKRGYGAIRCDAYLIGGFELEDGETANLGVELLLPEPDALSD